MRFCPGGTVLFAFPPAGAGPSLFRPWLPHIPVGVELVALLAPGRESRLHEPPLQHVRPLADAVAQAVRAYTDRPFAVFGHSMGALLATEVAGRLAAEPLELLVVAGSRPPHQPVDDLTTATDAEIVRALATWGGTPEEVLGDPDVLSVFLPGLRADFAVGESCRRPLSADAALDVPILSFVGTDDPLATPGDCAEWGRWSRASFEQRVVEGNHFFPFTRPSAVLSWIGTRLAGGPGEREPAQ